MPVIDAFVGFASAIFLTLLIYLLARWLEYKPATTSLEKTRPYLGGEMGFGERVQVFIKNFQYIITFVAFEMAILVLSFALYPALVDVTGIMIFLSLLIVALLIIAA